MLVLKEKFEYRIKRSNKTYFEASCKDIYYKFQLREIRMQEGSYWAVAKFIKDYSCQQELFNHYSRHMPTKVITSIITSKLQDNRCIICLKDTVEEMQTNHSVQILYNKALKVKEYAQNLVYGDLLHSF